jgi:hypothetical protein
MIRIIAKLFAAALVAILEVSTVHAAALFVSQNGGDTGSCTNDSSPCKTIAYAASQANFSGEEIACVGNGEIGGGLIAKSVTVDCNATLADISPLTINGSGITVVLRNFAIYAWPDGVTVLNGNLVMDNVHVRYTNAALQVLPTALSKVVVKNCIFDTNGAAVIIEPASGGSVSAEFDHVTIAENNGGGLKTDTINGPVTVDISNSTISNNTGNGMNAVSGAGGANVLNIRNSVIAANGTAGIQTNGANAAALIDMSLLDSNANGALTTINGGRLLTYGNNRIVGSAGSGFTGTAPSQ